MKKMLLLIGLALTLQACPPDKKAGVVPLTEIKTSLNGIEAEKAKTMVKQYIKNAIEDEHPKQASFFYSKEMVIAMVKLLKEEGADGIRIYFATGPSAATNQDEVAITLVSTKQGKEHPYDFSQGKFYHNDYYDHKPDADLFKLDRRTLGGQRSFDDCGGAARLYNDCGECRDDTNCGENPHFLTRKEATALVKEWKTTGVNKTIGAWYPLEIFQRVANTKDMSGMRIYFAKHLANDGGYPYAKNCFIIVPTRYSDKLFADEDFYDCEYATIFYKEVMSKNPNLKKEDPEDRGELCPDNCNEEGGPGKKLYEPIKK